MTEGLPIAAYDNLEVVRIEQARLLKERARGSCVIVEFIIFYTAVVMAAMNSLSIAILWFGLGTAMVLVTYAYAKLAARKGIGQANYRRFLQGHCAVSAASGAVWSGVAIYQIDYASEFTIFIACLTVCSITLGGVIPRSAYRPTYIALASFALVPLGIYVAVTAPGGIRLIGMGLLVYFLFTMFVSARVEIETRETILSRNARMLGQLISEKNDLYKRATAEKSRFLASVSHDMSQPLQSQRFFLRALGDVLTTPEQTGLMDKIEEAWRAQRDMLRSLVEVAQIDSGRVAAHPTPIKLEEHCARICAEFATGERDRPTLETQFEPVSVATDPALLARIIRNLLSNAIRYTEAHGTVRFELLETSNGAQIVIADTGRGMTQEEQERAFDAYFHADHEITGATDGMGLGLSIVRQLSNLLGIAIELESEPQRGSTFRLQVPATMREPPQAGTAPEQERVFEGNPLVVIVDDDDALLAAMTRVFTRWNCQVISAQNRREALRSVSLAGSDPSFLIVDLTLGDEDGLGVIRDLREECNFDIPAVLMSGNLGALTDQSLDDGITCLHKPIDPADIRLIMAGVIGYRAQANEGAGTGQPG